MMSATRGNVLSLYRSILRECKKLNQYNFRLYAIEKTKYEFHKNSGETNPEVISELIKKAQDNLDVLKRQVLISHMYGEGHLIIENMSPSQAS